MNSFDYGMKDVLALEGIRYDSKEVRVKCPFCGTKNLCINTEEGNERYVCHSGDCNFSGRGATNFYAQLHSLETKEAYKQIMELLGKTNDDIHYQRPTIKERKIEEEIPASEIADVQKRNATYMNLLNELKLSERHKKDLLDRGFSERDILELGYKTYPAMIKQGESFTYNPKYFEITKKLLVEGYTIKGVPGFYRTKNTGTWTLCNRKEAIMVPYVNFNNKIQGMQLRKNSDELDEDELKYSWLSSGNQREGCKVEGFVHYACDFVFDKELKDFIPLVRKDKYGFKSFSLTEGAMKGDLFHILTGTQVICVPGVGILEDFEKELIKLKSLGVDMIYNCYDMDYLTNPNVKNQCKKVEEMIISYGIGYKRVTWKQEVKGYGSVLKGIDDKYAYLKKGIIPVINKEKY